MRTPLQSKMSCVLTRCSEEVKGPINIWELISLMLDTTHKNKKFRKSQVMDESQYIYQTAIH